MTTPSFLVRLLSTRGFAGRLGPEDREALRFAMALRAAALELRLRCVWCHPPMELLRKNAQSALAAAMGAIEGSPDYLILWRSGSLVLEFKAKEGRQSPAQRDFQEWADLMGIPYYVVRSADQGCGILKAEGLLV